MADKDASTRELVFALPDIAKLLWRVVRDNRVSPLVRGGLVATAAYLVLPVDVIPDWVPLLGQLDDVVLLTVGVRTLLRRVPQRIVREHWSGERNVLETLLGKPLIDSKSNGG
ncbi:MAG: YkvA family protein [Actinomycetota bacterium]